MPVFSRSCAMQGEARCQGSKANCAALPQALSCHRNISIVIGQRLDALPEGVTRAGAYPDSKSPHFRGCSNCGRKSRRRHLHSITLPYGCACVLQRSLPFRLGLFFLIVTSLIFQDLLFLLCLPLLLARFNPLDCFLFVLY